MSRFAGIEVALAKPDADPEEIPNSDEPSEDETTNPKSKKKDKEMSDDTETAALADAEKKGHNTGFKAATDRMAAVFASEHYAGREAAAAKLLSKSMSAEDIIDVLADMPKIEVSALTEEQQREAAEAGGRVAMKDALAGSKNSNIDAGNEGKTDIKAESQSVWAKAYGLKDGVK